MPLTEAYSKAPADPSRHFGRATALLAALVIYGSLIPFAYNGLTFAEGLARFSDIRWLDFSRISRADWVANILLYIPITFAAMGWMAHRRHASYIIVFSGCMLLALGLEFIQVFYPPRTYSLNDLLAEFIGILMGLLLWFRYRQALGRLIWNLKEGGRRSIHAAGLAYLILYLLQSLFPYDFVLSLHELEARFDSGLVGLILAERACDGLLPCLLKPILETVMAMPLGLFIAMSSMRTRLGLPIAALTGLLLGLSLELLQLFLISGTSQGLSVLTRTLGVIGGFWLLRNLTPQRLKSLQSLIRPMVWLGIPLYLGLLLVAGGWNRVNWLPLSQGLEKLTSVSLIPFYYHYYSTESVATASLLMNMALYAPLGLAVWLWQLGGPTRTEQGISRLPLGLALIFAVPFETSKLFQDGRLPDYTNVLIGCAAALGAYLTLRWLSAMAWPGIQRRSRFHRGGSMPAGTSELTPQPATADAVLQTHPPKPATQPPAPVHRPTRQPQTERTSSTFPLPLWQLAAGRMVAALLLACLAALWWQFPTGRWPLAVGLLVYIVLLMRNPRIWLLVIPCLVPALDLAPLSGWFYWESVDFFLLATLIFALSAKTSSPGPRPPLPLGVLGLLGLAFGIGLLNGLLPLTPLDANTFSDYFSHYNALRVGKGFFWALFLLPLIRVTLVRRSDFTHYLLPGLGMGFVAVMVLVLWERHAFSGLLNFANEFRITGSFSSMHTGGGHIEAYLSLVLPLLAAGLFTRHLSLPILGLGSILLGLGSYALLVTFSRAGVLALAVSFTIIIIGLFATFTQHKGRHLRRRIGLLAGVLCIMTAAAIPILQGSYLQERFSQVQRDLGIRANHWQDAIGMMDDDLLTGLFGMGLGRFPESYLFHHLEDNLLSSFRFAEQSGNPFLQLVGGDSLYYEQIVPLTPNTQYRLKLDLRGNGNTRFTVPICAKSLLYSYDCRWISIRDIKADGHWHSYKVEFNSGPLGSGGLLSKRTTKLSLYNPAQGKRMDVDNVQLLAEDGTNLLKNGDFSAHQAHWFFSTDNHLPWHLKQLWIQVYFEQGLFGVLAFTLFLVVLTKRLYPMLRHGDILATGLAASLAAFLSVGLFASLFDAPRLGFLFFLISFAALLLPRQQMPS